MAIGQGAASRAALGVESTWGTGVAFTELIPFTSESISKVIQMLETEYLDGSAGRRSLLSSLIEALGDLSGEMVFDEISGGIIGIERLLRGSMGASAWDATNSLSQYTLNSTIDDSYTIGFNKQVSAWEVQGAKFKTLNLSGEAGGIIKFAVGCIAEDLYRTGDAGIINAIAAITGISPSNSPTPIAFDDLVFRIGDQANALASGDQYAINNFSLTLDNKLTDPTYASVDSSHTNSKQTLEPIRNGLREVGFQIQIPRYTSDQFATWQNAHTPLQADFIVTNGGYELNIFIPNLYISNLGAPIAGAEVIALDVEFMAIRNAGANTYMTLTDATAITEELAIEAKSNRTSAA